MARDQATLVELGVSCDALETTLALLIEAPRAGVLQRDGEEAPRELMEHSELVRAKVVDRFGSLDDATGFTAKVGGRFEIELTIYLGFQDCPWTVERGVSWNSCGAASTDWRIRNTARDLELSGPSLITHLIGKHGFFEGPASPYRVDPHALSELLELAPSSSH